MKYKNKKQKKTMLLLLILLGVSVGFALLSTTLKINGTASIKSNTWDIHWENVVPNQSSTITAETPTISNDGTTVTYEVELSLPGDFYEFTVDAKNDGTINGKIDEIRHTVKLVTIVDEEEVLEDTTLPSYILYSVVYDGTTEEPARGDILEAGDTKTYKVRIEYDPLAEVLPEADKVYRITEEIDYVQTKDRASRSIEDIMDEIEANPNAYRNQQQSVSNKDIGLDEDGNVINLDWWVDKDRCPGEKDYYLKTSSSEVTLGRGMCDDPIYGSMYTAATSAAQIVNGELQTPIPAYILFDGESEFYPVTEIAYVFGNLDDDEVETRITVFPKLPNTVTTIGNNLFAFNESLTTVVIPKNIVEIKENAFLRAGITNISFEEGSRLTSIGESGFYRNNFTSIVLPKNVQYVTGGSYPTFSNGVTVSYQD